MLNKEYYYNASIEDIFYLEGIDMCAIPFLNEVGRG
jgi:hypothetical protein